MNHLAQLDGAAAVNAPIGVFDSGVGGLSVYRHLKNALPRELFLYYADTKNMPYGAKSSGAIADLTQAATDWLVRRGAKLLVIACNSASAHSLARLRSRYAVPVVGLVPAIKPAVYATATKKIAVLATQATLQGAPFNDLVQSLAVPSGVRVYRHFEPKLAPWVEMGAPIDHHVARLLVDRLRLWIAQNVDTLVLGCTHYPFFRPFLEDEIARSKARMTLLDSGHAIALRVQSLLEEARLLADRQDAPPLYFFASRSVDRALVGALADDAVIFIDDFTKTAQNK